MQGPGKTRKKPDAYLKNCGCSHGKEATCPLKGRYIVEKIISSRKQQLFFKGKLELLNLQPSVCVPLTLCDAKVVSIQPCGREECGYILLKVVLLLHLVDARGCAFSQKASFEARALNDAPALHEGMNLRRGASVQISQADFCPPCGFTVCLKMTLHTVASCSESAENMDCVCREAPQIPLYPQPCDAQRRRWR